jgi:hypothetical protein
MEVFDLFEKSYFYYILCDTVCGAFHDLKNVLIAEKSLKISHFLANFQHDV